MLRLWNKIDTMKGEDFKLRAFKATNEGRAFDISLPSEKDDMSRDEDST
jgi:hypothetical protein